MSVVSTSSGKVFTAEANETLLEAALRAGVVLEHGCCTGRCGSCKGRVRSGDTLIIHDESGLTDVEKTSGWILTCARSAIGDVVLDIDALTDICMHQIKTLPCKVHQLTMLSSDVMKVVLRLPPTQSFQYHPGQYVDVIGFNGLRRSYSIASAYAVDGFIELHIRRVAGGAMSRYWFEQAKNNDLLRLNGPKGTFFLRDTADRDLIFLATGTGMAPIKAILEFLAVNDFKSDQQKSLHVYWGGRTLPDLYWDPRAIGMVFQYTPVLSRETESDRWASGYVQTACLASHHDLSNSVVYACGSSNMIESARASLTLAGLPLRNFRSDAFLCSA